MQTLYTTQSELGQLSAATVLEVQAVPELLPQAFVAALLAGCDVPETSCEMTLMSDGTRRGTVRLLLTLRQTGRNPHRVADELELRRRVLVERLDQMGFQTAVLEASACYGLVRELATRGEVALCFPGEHLRRVRLCYAPGGYDAVSPLELSEIIDALASHEGGFSVQLRAARMFPEETQAIRSHLGWLKDRPGSPEAAEAARAFSAALSMADLPVFFVVITAWGDDEAMQRMLQSFRQRGFATLMLPRELLRRRDYLTEAPETLYDYVASEAHILERGIRLPRGCHRLTHLAPARLLSALLLPRDGLPVARGLKVNRIPRDDAPLPASLTGDGVALGVRVSDGQRVAMPLNRFSKHAVVTGMPGTGKTTFLFHLLLELNDRGIPFLAVEPSKTEYRALMDAMPRLRVYTPGNSAVAPLMFNPFLPPRGVPLEKYLPSLETAFLTAFSMHSPLDVIFPEVLRTCYIRYGWRMDSTVQSREARAFGMREFIEVFREEVRRSGYDSESRANLESGGVYRFQSLLNANGVLFDTDRPLPEAELLREPVLIELDAIGNPEQKSLLLSLLLIQLNLIIRRDQLPDGSFKNAIMIDEAHVLLGQAQRIREARDADPMGRTVAFLQQMVLENRAYGTGMIFADQSPAKLGPEIVGNSDIQLIFRLNNAADRRILADNLNLSRQASDGIEALPVGQCFLKTQDLEKPVRLVTPDDRASRGLKAMLPDEAVHGRYGVMPTPFGACACADCDIGIRNEAEFIARSIADGHREELADPQRAEAFVRGEMMELLKRAVAERPGGDRLMNCSRMFLVRQVGELIARAGR